MYSKTIQTRRYNALSVSRFLYLIMSVLFIPFIKQIAFGNAPLKLSYLGVSSISLSDCHNRQQQKESILTGNELFLIVRPKFSSKMKYLFSPHFAYNLFYLQSSKNTIYFHIQCLSHLLQMLQLNTLCALTVPQRLVILLDPYRTLLYSHMKQILH